MSLFEDNTPPDSSAPSVQPEGGGQEDFIKQLKLDNEQLRKQLQDLASAQATLKELLERKNSDTPQPKPAQPETGASAEALKAELAKLAQEQASSALQGWQTKQVQDANEKVCMEAAKSKFGSEYSKKLLELGTDLGYDKEQLTKLGRENPKAFKRLFGLEDKTSSGTPAPTSGSRVPADPVPQAPQRKSGGYTTTADMKAAWQAAGKKVASELGVDYTTDLHRIPKRQFSN